jgi:hypothetical protein
MLSNLLNLLKGANTLAVLLASLVILATWTGGVMYGKLSNKLDVSNNKLDSAVKTNELLAQSAKKILEIEDERQRIEDILTKKDDGKKLRSPVLLRTTDLVRKCGGKTTKCDLQDTTP